ncbi:MAG: branched-chain amino acid transport system II carrier protein, partial [Ectopseudomonas oleovorans]
MRQSVTPVRQLVRQLCCWRTLFVSMCALSCPWRHKCLAMPAVVRAKRSGDVSPDPSRKPPQLFDILLVVFPFMTRLKGSDLLALGFMTFALF